MTKVPDPAANPDIDPAAAVVDVEDLPLLGEPAVVELANTLYLAGQDVLDILADPATRTAWLARLVMDPPAIPARLTAAETMALMRLRDAVADLLRAVATAARPASASIATINKAAGAAPLVARLDWPPGQPARAVTHPAAGAAVFDVVLGRLAVDAICLVTGPHPLRVCAGPGCGLLFVARHRRRRFCHHSCSHRARQAAYYHRHHPPVPHRPEG
ncbi:MAG TPA: CGNR zinc finger domain-containing protein [Streptosporangiaceae bacterium]|nr:CGNR zinc finger domain-containing protein [Streptosporangiaceae bacterium]